MQGREDESEYAYAYAETGATSRELANRAESYEVPVSLTAEPTRPNIYAVPESDQQVRALLLHAIKHESWPHFRMFP